MWRWRWLVQCEHRTGEHGRGSNRRRSGYDHVVMKPTLLHIDRKTKEQIT
jgi:hypothetical protein